MSDEFEGESENPMLVRVGETRIINMGSIIDARYRDAETPVMVLRYPVADKNGDPLRVVLKGDLARIAWEQLYERVPMLPYITEDLLRAAAAGTERK